jgi:hypothetical protein
MALTQVNARLGAPVYLGVIMGAKKLERAWT